MKKLVLFLMMAAILCGCNEPQAVEELSFGVTENAIATTQNEFAVNLLRQVAADGGENVFISPLSAGFACAMTVNAAKGATYRQLMSVLAPDDYDVADLNGYYQQLIEKLPHLDNTTQLSIANALWMGHSSYKSYVDVLQTYYKADVDSIDLSDPHSAKIINDWADNHTNGCIKNICDPSMFNEDLHLVLANVLYFKGKWANKFSKSKTHSETFYLANGDTKDVKMMQQKAEFGVTPSLAFLAETYNYDWRTEQPSLSDLPVRMLTMYYKDKKYCVDILLPDEDVDMNAVLANLTVERYERMCRREWECDVEVRIPRLSMRYHRRLNDDMKALGVTDVFSNDADLTGMSDHDVRLDQLLQDTYLVMNEEGTEAAAVTSGWFMDKAEAPAESPFIVNRPYLLFIREAKTGIILFAGRIESPEE